MKKYIDLFIWLGILILGILLLVLDAHGGTWAWQSVGAGFNDTVYALQYEGKWNRLYAGGDFEWSSGTYVQRLCYCIYPAISSPEWIRLGANDTVRALATDSSEYVGTVWVGGDFTYAGVGGAGGASAAYVAKYAPWNASFSALSTGLNNTCYSLAFDPSGNLYAGGKFLTAGGVTAYDCAKWNGSAWSALTSGEFGWVYSLGINSGGEVFIGDSEGDWWIYSLGILQKWGENSSGSIYAQAVDSNNNIYIGGAFTDFTSRVRSFEAGVGSSDIRRVVKFDSPSFTRMSTGLNGTVYSLAVDDDDNIYAGGSFTAQSGGTAGTLNYVAKWNGTAWSALTTGLNGTVYALDWDSDNDCLYAGGAFTTAGGSAAYRVARYIETFTPSPTPIPTATQSPTPSVTPTPIFKPTPKMTPSVTPTPVGYEAPSPSPVCQPQGTGKMAWNITDAVASTWRSDTSNGWRMRWFSLHPTTKAFRANYGNVYDAYHPYAVATANNYGYLGVQIVACDDTPAIREGDYYTLTLDGAAFPVYFPAVYEGDTLYVGSDGATYYDKTLCVLAEGAGPEPTKSPSPVTTPTPYAGQCLEYTQIPLTESQTALYQELNDSFQEIEAVLNGGITGMCLDPEFAIGYGQISDDAIGNDQMRDYAITRFNVQTGAITGGTAGNIAAGTIASFNINTTIGRFDFNDVFPGSYQLNLPYMSSWGVYDKQWKIECMPYWSPKAGSLRISFRTDTDSWVSSPIIINPEDYFIGLNGITNPTSSLDIGGSMRLRGAMTLDKGLSFPWTNLVVNDKTPTVSGGMNFKTANTSATSISDFDNGINGQRIMVFINDANTTFNNQSTSSLWTTDTNGPFWGTQTSIYQFVLMGTQWYQYPGTIYSHTASGTITPGTWSGVAEDFESGGWDQGQGWTGAWAIDGSNTKVNDVNPHGGTYACRIGEGAGISRQFSTVGIGSSATVSLYTYRDVNLEYKTSEGAAWTTLTGWDGSAAYSSRTYTWASPAPTTTMYIRLSNGGTSYAYVDDLTIQ